MGEIAYATAFVAYYREAKEKRLAHPSEYAAFEATLVSVEAIEQWAEMCGRKST